jgi:CBS domain-containing protein
MKAADVMVRNVITVGPDACVQDVAHILLTARISGVPVVGANGELVGIVSEGDLMRRVEAGTGRRRPWWLAIFTGREALAMEFIREHSRKVDDVMTREVITAAPDTPLWKIAIYSRRTRSSAFQSWRTARWSASSAVRTCCKPWPV